MTLNIVLVTNTDYHHKYWAYSIYEKYNVVAILHPNEKINYLSAIRKRKIFYYGYTIGIMKLFSIFYNLFSKHGFRRNIAFYEKEIFHIYDEKYNTIPKEIIHYVDTVNDPDVIRFVKSLNVDVICFLGGDIAKKEFINSAKVATLNYHSGLSPFYNGSKTIFHAVSDFCPNFVGGTLMYMTERIDGGHIISHYITPIESKDNAVTLFLKGIKGAVKLYDIALTEFEKGNRPLGIKQGKEFKYVRFRDWTILQDMKLRSFHKKIGMDKFKRNEKILLYGGDVNAHPFSELLTEVLR